MTSYLNMHQRQWQKVKVINENKLMQERRKKEAFYFFMETIGKSNVSWVGHQHDQIRPFDEILVASATLCTCWRTLCNVFSLSASVIKHKTVWKINLQTNLRLLIIIKKDLQILRLSFITWSVILYNIT